MAQNFDGNKFIDFCRTNDASSCDGLRLGLLLSLQFWNELPQTQGGPVVKYCVPAGVATTQAMDVVSAYIESHPESRHFPVGYLAFMALFEAFPC